MEHIEIEVYKETRILAYQNGPVEIIVTVKVVSMNRNRKRMIHHSYHPLKLPYDCDRSRMQYLRAAVQIDKAHVGISRVLNSVKG